MIETKLLLTTDSNSVIENFTQPPVADYDIIFGLQGNLIILETVYDKQKLSMELN